MPPLAGQCDWFGDSLAVISSNTIGEGLEFHMLQGEESPLPRHAAEAVDAAILEAESGPRQGVLIAALWSSSSVRRARRPPDRRLRNAADHCSSTQTTGGPAWTRA